MSDQKKSRLKAIIFGAQGKISSDLLLKNCYVIDVYMNDIILTDVAILGDRIVGVGFGYEAKEIIDLQGYYVAPGFIDAHFHVESSMLLPSKLSKYLLMNGTTCVVSDPHEIANVMGVMGILGMIKDSESAMIDYYFTAPSCVPSTDLETSGDRVGPEQLFLLRKEPRIIGLSEVMDFLSVLNAKEEMLEKLLIFTAMHGHAPTLGDKGLSAYVAAGIDSDHETTSFKEGLEKLRAGMFLMVREGSNAKNLEELLPLIGPHTSLRACLVSDDLSPKDLMEEGHINRILKKAVSLGMDPLTAIRLVTLSPALYLGLKDRGAVAPGKRADLVILEDLKGFSVEGIIKDGRYWGKGELISANPTTEAPNYLMKPIKIPPLTPMDLEIKASKGLLRVIELIPGQILTEVGLEVPKIEKGNVVADPQRDILKLVVVERHKSTGNMGKCFVKGFGLRRGAMATSVAHDSHNLICVGADDVSMTSAINRLRDMGGGLVVSLGDEIVEGLALPYGGLMCDLELEGLVARLHALEEAASRLGARVPHPFMTLSFMALPVVPKLKLTDKGLVDVMEGKIVGLFG
jgi:adenine deaminase